MNTISMPWCIWMSRTREPTRKRCLRLFKGAENDQTAFFSKVSFSTHNLYYRIMSLTEAFRKYLELANMLIAFESIYLKSIGPGAALRIKLSTVLT